MATFRNVKTSFWTDDKVVNDFSPEDKLFFLYLLTNPHTTQLGIYPFVPKIAAFELGYSLETVKVLMDRFENKYNMIKYSSETGEIAIKNHLLHSVIKGGKPVYDCLMKEEKAIKDKSLLEYIVNNIANDKRLNDTIYDFINDISNMENIKDKNNDNERIVIDDSFRLKDLVIEEATRLPDRGVYKCEWCGNKVEVVEKHHFPIPKRFGGLDTVSICHDCHARFHKLEYRNRMGAYSSSQKVDLDIDKIRHDIDDEAQKLFDSVWKLYPKKRGKGSVSQTQKRKLLNVGYDNLVKCIDRYKHDVEGKDMQYIKNGSTFFNSGYIDYLDENWEQANADTTSEEKTMTYRERLEMGERQ